MTYEDPLFDFPSFENASNPYRNDDDDLFGSLDMDVDSNPPSTVVRRGADNADLFKSDDDLFGSLDFAVDFNPPSTVVRRGADNAVALTNRRRRVKLALLAAGLVAIVGAAGVAYSSTRPFSVDLVSNLNEPGAIETLNVGAPVARENAIVGRVASKGRDEFNEYARLKIDRSATPLPSDCQFRIEETPLGLGVMIEGGTQGAPTMQRGTTVVLSEKKNEAAKMIVDRVKSLLPRRPSSIRGSKTAKGKSTPAIIGLLSLGAVGFLLRKTLKFIAIVGASLGGLILVLRAFSGFPDIFDRLIHLFQTALAFC